MNNNESHLDAENISDEQLLDLIIDNLKQLILSRAWCRTDYQRMNERIETIRQSIKINCYVGNIAKQKALIEHIFMRLLYSDEAFSDAFCGLDFIDNMLSDYES